MSGHKITFIAINYKDEISSFITQLWKLVSGPLSLLLIPIFLLPTDQGFWYTFASLSALAIFADLGFSVIVMQFSAHEFAYLKIESGVLVGNSNHIARLASLFKFIIKWTSIMIAIVFPIIAIIGFIIFNNKDISGYWILPWVIYMISSVGAFIGSVLSSFLQGLNQIARTQKITLISSICTTLIMVSLLILGTKLYALSMSFLFGTVVNLILLFRSYRKIFVQLLEVIPSSNNWRHELLPLLGKYSIAWMSSYFSFQIFTPLVFHFKGPIDAGKIGITLTLVNAIYSLSRIWLVAKTPKMNMLVAERKWQALDLLFKKTMTLSVLTYCAGALILFVIYITLSNSWQFFDLIRSRFANFTSVSILILGWLLQLFVSGISAYLRAHKKEVLMYIFLFSGVFVVLSTYLLVKYFAIDYIFLGFFLSYILFGYAEYKLFIKNKLGWHSN